MAIDVLTKEELLENIRTSGRTFAEAARELPPERWSEGRYEEGWTAKDILAHVASIEWTYPKLLDVARGLGPPPKAKDDAKPADLPGGYNQRHVEKRKGNSVEELIDEFERNREATIAAVQEAADDVLRVPVRSAGGVEGKAVEVLNYVAVVHVQDHLADIRGAGA
jgi:uncharacterized protein (TIGR03083 family)